jgi:hypothetical protein
LPIPHHTREVIASNREVRSSSKEYRAMTYIAAVLGSYQFLGTIYVVLGITLVFHGGH